jgi:NAD(P)-dependent dehydrogenase (short-subunit alcohol dehydrogenase family)
MSTWLITGCSTGLGRALAETVIGAGHNAVVTARDVTRVADLADTSPERVLPVALDVTKPEQVASAVERAQERFGGVDVLVNNAGYGYRAAIEEGDDAGVRTLFETHFFGTVAMIKAVLPGMRARRSGAIVNISSIGVQLTPVGSGYYSAAKAAIEGLSGALRIPDRLRRPFARPVGHGHRRLRHHRRAASQRERHHARQPGRRPRQGRRCHRRGRRIK